MKNLFYILFFGLLLGCTAQEKLNLPNGEDVLSLNGNWKFHAIYGEGSNYLNIHEAPDDIIIDNADAQQVKITGKWNLLKEGKRGSTFYKNDYLQHNFNNGEDSASVKYFPNLKESGYYEAFVMFPFESHLTAQANVFHAEGKTTKFFIQRSYCGEWLSLGIFDFKKSDTNYVELTAIAEGSVAADAVMFRPISEEKYLIAKKEPQQVFLPDFDDSNWHNLKVPGHWGMINSFSNYNGNAWYRKEITLPENWKDNENERIRLKFDGVYHVSNIYVNGKLIGSNRGGFTPFEFDVTDAINFNGKNIVAVEVNNSKVVGATWNWGGIIRDVELIKNNNIRISHQYMHANPDLKTGKATIHLKVRIENNASEAKKINVNTKIFDTNHIGSLSGNIEIPANTSKEIYLETELKNVELWHFDNPKLYQFETTISEENNTLHKLKDNFGIRKVTLTDSQMLLNGEPVRLAGFNRVSEHRFWGSSEPMHVLEKDVDLMKESGANFMRIMHGTQNKKLIELCDKKGILLFEEVNVRDLDNEEFTPPHYPLVKKWLKGMIERDINHPSIIGWSVGNELSNHFNFAKTTMDYVRSELDPYRLLTCVSNSGQKEAYTRETDPNTIVDIIMHNMYAWQGEPQEILNTLREKWPNKPIFISEYGFDPFPSPSLDIDKPILSEWMEHYRHKNEFVIGTSMWTFNDYRSGYAATSAEENRVWGIVNAWKQKRRYFERVKKEHSPVKDIEVSNIDFNKNNADVTIAIRGVQDYPSYAMYDYKLVYQFNNSTGDIIIEKTINLPDLHPKDGLWKGNITWEKLSANPSALTVKLVSPTNYSRSDKTISFTTPVTPEISEIIQGNNSVRILFDKVANASEYFVTYKNDEGKLIESYKTITNAIDIDGLQNQKEYNFKLFAINNKGTSKASKEIKATPNENELPPLVWDTFITDKKLVIGYSSDLSDGIYTVRYGNSKTEMNKTFASNVRGMMSIDLEDENDLYLQIKRNTNSKESNWSNIIKATKH